MQMKFSYDFIIIIVIIFYFHNRFSSEALRIIFDFLFLGLDLR